MHGTLQPDDRSPKQVNAIASTSQIKSGCDSGQNSGASFPSQGKVKKRERDHGADPSKRERLAKADDVGFVKCRPVTNLKSDIARITEKGGAIGMEGVEKLIQLMQTDRNKDLMSRSMLTAVIAATDKTDCLNQFVQLGGLPVLDEWLQDIHKGKIGDGYSLKDGDKSVEDFLLVLLRALDKLPVNLHALQTCNIGRSVNHLRSHKNTEIQRKARSLVDTWKKRVEAEMISIDTKSGSAQAISAWPSKSRLPEAAQGGSRTVSGSEVVLKSSVTQNSMSKTTLGNSSHGESDVKSVTLSPGTLKSASSPGSSGKESQPTVSPNGANSDVSPFREDMGSSSNQSNNCAQSLSGKDDGKGSSAGLMTVGKITSSTIRTRRNSGIHTVSVTGQQKESSSSRNSSSHKSNALEKVPPSSNFEKASDGPVNEGSSHKLVVKLSNHLHSPVQGSGAESEEDPIMFRSSRGSSPVLLDKQEQLDQNSKDKTYSWQIVDSKDVSIGSVDDIGSHAAIPEEEPSVTTDESRRLLEGLPENQLNPSKLQSSSFSPMTALVESCVKYSEANSTLSLEDDVGMNLLASVAAGEMSRFDSISPTDSTERSTPMTEENCIMDKDKSESSIENYATILRSRLCVDNESNEKNQAVVGSSLLSDDGLNILNKVSRKYSNENKCVWSHTSEGGKLAGEGNVEVESRISAKWDANEIIKSTGLSMTIYAEKLKDVISMEINNPETVSTTGTDGSVMQAEEKNVAVVDAAALIFEIAGSNQLRKLSVKDSNEELKTGIYSSPKVAATSESEFSELNNRDKIHQTQYSVSETTDGVILGKLDEKNAMSFTTESRRCDINKDVGKNHVTEAQDIAILCSISTDVKVDEEAMAENKLVVDRGCFVDDDTELKRTLTTSNQPDESKSHSTVPKVSAVTAAIQRSDTDSKLKFDLNEGFSAEDVKYGDSSNLISSVSSTVQMLNSVPISISPALIGMSASITVAAAAKGAFIPPEDLVNTKGELRWKGSAATSAFRPAEPRKFPDSTNSPCSDASIGRNGRVPLDIDLNVPDERLLEEMASRESALIADSTDFSSRPTSLNESLVSVLVHGSGGLDLDLNSVDETNNNLHCSTSSYARTKPLSGVYGGDIRRDFDLNDGPVVDYSISEHFSTRKQVKGGMPSYIPSASLRMSSPAVGNYSSWFPPGNTFSTVSVPTILPDPNDQPFPVFPTGAHQRTFDPIGVSPLTPDVYRGSVLSSCSAVPFSSSPFQYPVFPFGASFPLSSGTFSVGANSFADSSTSARLFTPTLNSQFLGSAGSATSQFQRPYIANISDIANGGFENNIKWGRHGLDLNGPVVVESDAKEEPFAQNPVASSQAVVEEQAWMYSVPGGILKRKDPEDGWDCDNLRYKQFSWQ